MIIRLHDALVITKGTAVHPLHIDLEARVRTADRHERAAIERRARALLGPRPHLRDRVGAALVAFGTRVQHQHARPSTRHAVAR